MMTTDRNFRVSLPYRKPGARLVKGSTLVANLTSSRFLLRRDDRFRWLPIAILGAIAFLAAIGYSLPSILLQPTKADLRMTDTEIGLINGLAITIVGAVAAFPIGWAADRFGRRRVLALCILIWSAFVGVMAFSQSVITFAIGAVGFNLGDAALLPLIYGILAATFHGKQRDTANAMLVSLLLVGSFGVYAVGGGMLEFFARHSWVGLAPWRLTCLTVAVMGPFAAALLVWVPNPSQPALPQAIATANADETFLAYLRRHGGFLFLLMAGNSLYFTAFTVFMFWAPAVLERAFGMPADQANSALGLYLTFASIAAIALTFAVLPRFTARWTHSAPLIMVVAGCLIVLIPAAGLLIVDSAFQFLIAASAIAFGMSIAMMLAPGLMQSCAPDRFRSRTIALFPLFAGLMRIVQPALVGGLSTYLGETGDVLLTILAVLMIVSFGASVVILTLLSGRYSRLAQQNAD
ncbi:MAG: MFS transporter [Blastomonas sp.]|jgi:MFS family permease|uniref:MFS transporter n=1 Tax=Blastomonas sp. TaxID=1909299 RepID=UPI0025831F2D|nr:MFS transporter [Blastomonas sp.]MCO5792553.1 MFS transporter [Blastomonas sp.]